MKAMISTHCYTKKIFSFALTILIFCSFHNDTLFASQIKNGIEVLLSDDKYKTLISGKRIGLVTNHTATNADLQSTIELIKNTPDATLVALFAPEHGINGSAHADHLFGDSVDPDGIPIYSLHGKTRRPTAEMLKNINLIIFDLQDIGSRSYTYLSTLCYVMEEAAKHNIHLIVADRPNPMGGLIVDGLMLDPTSRSR